MLTRTYMYTLGLAPKKMGKDKIFLFQLIKFISFCDYFKVWLEVSNGYRLPAPPGMHTPSTPTKDMSYIHIHTHIHIYIYIYIFI